MRLWVEFDDKNFIRVFLGFFCVFLNICLRRNVWDIVVISKEKNKQTFFSILINLPDHERRDFWVYELHLNAPWWPMCLPYKAEQCRLQSLQCAPDCSMMSHPFQCVTATPTAEDRSTFITIERSSSSGVDIKSWQRLAQGLTRFTWKTCQHLVQNDTYYPSPRS